jgi:hypothetical protein
MIRKRTAPKSRPPRQLDLRWKIPTPFPLPRRSSRPVPAARFRLPPPTAPGCNGRPDGGTAAESVTIIGCGAPLALSDRYSWCVSLTFRPLCRRFTLCHSSGYHSSGQVAAAYPRAPWSRQGKMRLALIMPIRSGRDPYDGIGADVRRSSETLGKKSPPFRHTRT